MGKMGYDLPKRCEQIKNILNMDDEDYKRTMYELFADVYGKKADIADKYECYSAKVDAKLNNWYRISFDWKWVVSNLSHKTGLYAFYNHKEKLVYIGKSTDLARRIASSLKDRPDVIDRIDYIVFDNKSDADIYELLYIAKYKPIYNNDCNRKDKSVLVELLGSEISMQKFKTVPSYKSDCIGTRRREDGKDQQ